MTTHEQAVALLPRFDEIISRKNTTSSGSLIPYQNLTVVKLLNKAKFPVYLVHSNVDGKQYAMKIFSHIGENPDSCYVNEVRFATLQHPNVVSIVNYQNERKVTQKDTLEKVSYILMEYAPHGDLFNFIVDHKAQIDEKLVRTFFRQLIDGIEYLHERGIAHLDIKPENLLLGSDFNLKIADFDLSYVYGDSEILSKGTKFYRGPELIKHSYYELDLRAPFPADIYGAGIILYILKSGGMYPHSENNALKNGIIFEDLMYKNNKKFWEKHCEIQRRSESFYDEDFRDLFNNMVKANPKERFNIKQIKQSNWYNGPVYTMREFQEKMRSIFSL